MQRHRCSSLHPVRIEETSAPLVLLISLVRVSGASLIRCFIDSLASTQAFFLLAEQLCWHPILPDPAWPFRQAPRPDLPVVCPGFGFDRCENQGYNIYKTKIGSNILVSCLILLAN